MRLRATTAATRNTGASATAAATAAAAAAATGAARRVSIASVIAAAATAIAGAVGARIPVTAVATVAAATAAVATVVAAADSAAEVTATVGLSGAAVGIITTAIPTAAAAAAAGRDTRQQQHIREAGAAIRVAVATATAATSATLAAATATAGITRRSSIRSSSMALTPLVLRGVCVISCLFVLAAGKVPAQTPTNSWRDLFFGNKWLTGPIRQRESKFLPIFTVMPFGANSCAAPSGELGNCMANKDCQLRNGIPAGPCGGGYGVCCIFLQTCGGVIRENSTYFVNPNHPDVYDGTGSCQVTVQKLHPDICQLRLDLDMFSIAPPEAANHLCNQDQLLISGGSPTPTICGSSTGDHMYIDAGLGQSNPIVLSVITSASFPRLWRVRVTQIHCGSISRADQGCLQYYTAISGRVRSFNYNTVGGRQLSNQDYSICIRNERNFCGIQYNACPDLENNRSRSFTLTGNSNNPVATQVGGGGSAAPNSNGCLSDWLLIGCIRSADRIPPLPGCEDRVCGGTFSAEAGMLAKTVQSSVRPFRLYFHTDGVEAPNDIDNRGFCLDYVQQPCTNGF